MTQAHTALSWVALNAERRAAWLAFTRAIMAWTSSSRAASTTAGGGVTALGGGVAARTAGGGVGLRGCSTASGLATCGARGVGVNDPGRGMVYGIGEATRCWRGLFDRLDASLTARMNTDTSCATSGISGPLGTGDLATGAPVRDAAGGAALLAEAEAAAALARASAAAAALAGSRPGGAAGGVACCGCG